ncbi:pre-mRNA-splicing factor syf2 [Trichoglossum hirsutum]|uniref:Pre-mRNA-splicing factor SYF2 n=1 Tax=Trichoglossum hirsutum TaxID=265104 RepID=A0A9P8L6T7_9PEZI|nr:pre-mRNA-splicing factor syf2 [Trichoglossum hirsutum]
MPPSKKRKGAARNHAGEASPKRVSDSEETPGGTEATTPSLSKESHQEQSEDDESAKTNTAALKALERKERFKALQARAKKSAERNLKEAAAESQRLSTDPNLLASLSRKRDFAAHNLLKADTAAAGEDFERKRAWDWTVEESEKWDKRMEKKERHREDVAFQDYRQDARKVYKRQLREIKPDLERYEKEKMAAVQRAAVSGGLEIVETDDGELVAVDKDGRFYSTADSTDFAENKPDRAAVDRLVSDLRKAEEVRLKKRRERGRDDDDGDVTYINEKNKLMNKRLDRFYNKVRWHRTLLRAIDIRLLIIVVIYSTLPRLEIALREER